ncbi:hypothetical protein [Dyadobacter fanqingshengii]|uniref:Type VI secretion system baseplate subunit TssG n=1 Tax=Dyadobacter fanqingshengii TaxID=2906443 RepID=A0A9X1T8C6_9BACT|nr:hypothetical protein [Dyadobacter fanqingshengii]MCF0040040.1 hypothetical protein [Dyadobacter fanqingshengii]USJ38208.1 hypothetical protein NFI81_10560 [Dyadobacter fanqingshengii]
MEIYQVAETLLALKTDLRAETVAREIAEAAIHSPENILLTPVGAFNRSGSRDVTAVTEENRDTDFQITYSKVRMAREGISDMLPPGMIFQPTISRSERSTEVVLEDIDYYETGINQARTFFSPFDIEFGRQRVALEMHEHHSVVNPFAHYHDTLFDYLWPDLDLELSPEQKEAILELTIHAHLIVGNMPACQVYFEKVLGQKVVFETDQQKSNQSIGIDFLQPLGKGTLGVDWILHGKYQDPDHINIRIGPVADNELYHFRSHEPLGKHYRTLTFLCGLLLPAEITWDMLLIAERGFFTINKTRETGVLGYSTIL